MSYQDLLTDRCSIYHLSEATQPSSYGVPGETEYKYPLQPDLTNVPCLFGKESKSIVKNEPGVTIIQSTLVHFFIDADVLLNDKVVFNGISYRLEVPKNVRNHHIEVTAVRDGSL